MNNAEKFILNSNIRYHKILGKGAKNTTANSNGDTVVLYSGVPEDGTWLVGLYNEGTGNPGQLQSGPWGYVKPNGDLCVDIQRGSPITTEIFYWRVYAD